MTIIIKLKTLLTKVEEMEEAGIEIPENLLQAIDSLAGQLEPFLKDSPQKAELDALERRELINNIFFSLWRIFYNDIYQGILEEYKKKNLFCEKVGDDRSKQFDIKSSRKKDASKILTEIHRLLVAEWKFTIPPLIEQICLPDGYLGKPSLASDARPLSLEKYSQYQKEKKRDGIDLGPEYWFFICSELAINEQSYHFICHQESDIALGEEAMTYEEFFRCFIKEHPVSISDNFDIYD
jgi:hypothetical protein